MLRKVLGITGGFLLVFSALARADEIQQKTVVTINEPVIVAGTTQVTLQPGRYVLKRLNNLNDRHFVVFYNEDMTKVFVTAMALNNYRLVPTDKTVLKYWETPKGNPPALRAWFPSGERWGQEFVYPKGLAEIIARQANAPVLIAEAKTEKELETAPIREVEPSGKEVPLEEAYVAPPAAAPEPAPVEVAAAPPPAEPLPATGSPIFDIGLLGMIAAGAGMLLRKIS